MNEQQKTGSGQTDDYDINFILLFLICIKNKYYSMDELFTKNLQKSSIF